MAVAECQRKPLSAEKPRSLMARHYSPPVRTFCRSEIPFPENNIIKTSSLRRALPLEVGASTGSISPTQDQQACAKGVALGSTIQIALLVAPVLVLASCFIAPQPLLLSFDHAEFGMLFLGVLMGMIVCGDGQPNCCKNVRNISVTRS